MTTPQECYVLNHRGEKADIFEHEMLTTSWKFGPLTISFDAGLNPPHISLSATLLGVSIGKVDITPEHPTARLGGSFAGFTAELDISVDFSARTITIEGKVGAPFIGTKSFKKTFHF